MIRSAGILLPISSLPSPYGIGTFGKAAYEFADFLREAGQTYWQMLPLGPTSYGDSPYQSFSAFAGNPYYIDLDMLIDDGLLTYEEVNSREWGSEPRYVDYGKIYESRFVLLAQAKERGWKRYEAEINKFLDENISWLPNYVLFMACKRHFDMKSWLEWPDDALRLRDAAALSNYSSMLKEDIELFTFIQFLFYKQWNLLRDYIHQQGLLVIGDIPIYVALDSADVWSEQEFFQLDEKGFPLEVSGVPPDYFSEDGQLWGNPLYDWDKMKADGYGWWIRRIDGAAKLFDVIRFDHFRGLESYWAVPFGETTAKNGKWRKGPGMELISTLNGWFPNISFIAEDLGFLTPEVAQLLKDSGWPGMKVLQFAFDSGESSNYLPHTYNRNCVCYTGTHDNAPLALWREEASEADLAYASEYLGIHEAEGFNLGVIRGGLESVANLFIAPIQDYLNLGRFHRINTPGTSVGNWQWRLLDGEASQELAEGIFNITKLYGR